MEAVMSTLCTVCNHYPCPGCLGAAHDEIGRLKAEIVSLAKKGVEFTKASEAYIGSLKAELRDERELTDALVALVPRCDQEDSAGKRCDRPATRQARGGIFSWCDECAHDHYVIYSGTPRENLYPSPCATVNDKPIAELLRAIQKDRAARTTVEPVHTRFHEPPEECPVCSEPKCTGVLVHDEFTRCPKCDR
jgi:hypothetical protein